MFQLWTISLFVILVVHDSVYSTARVAASDSAHAPLLFNWLGPPGVTAATLVPLALVAIGVHVFVGAGIRRLNRGDMGAAYRAERAVAISRWVVVFLHGVNVLLLGWLDAVRLVMGDLVVVDEAVAITPALLVFMLGWVSVYPIERAVRESTLVRTLDEGLPAYPIPSRREFVGLNLRHNLLLSIVPLFLILAWAELVERGLAWGARFAASGEADGWAARLMLTQPGRELAAAVLQIIGVLGVFIVGPLVMRVLWDTKRLPAGALRDRLLEICRAQGIRVRELLVWRTHGTMINGAVIGLLAPARYILLTDALIDSMPGPQVEAVMAHELAHVRQHHMGWLAVVMLVGVGYSAAVGSIIVSVLGLPFDDTIGGAAVQLVLAVGAFAVAMLLFGFVSRRFEWQADALAAAFLSQQGAPADTREGAEPVSGPSRDADGQPALQVMPSLGMIAGAMSLAGDPPSPSSTVPPPPALGVITPAGAGAMAGALDTVARLNHIPHDRHSWRHGSIAARQRRLATIVGVPAARLPINASARIIKRGAAVLLLVLFLAGLVSTLLVEAPL